MRKAIDGQTARNSTRKKLGAQRRVLKRKRIKIDEV
jgi:hypothetical protein